MQSSVNSDLLLTTLQFTMIIPQREKILLERDGEMERARERGRERE